ncbi:MAG: signal peptide peptidase SppA [Phycisphaerales bacterium]
MPTSEPMTEPSTEPMTEPAWATVRPVASFRVAGVPAAARRRGTIRTSALALITGLIALPLLASLGGCSGYRVVLEPVKSPDAWETRTVRTAPEARRGFNASGGTVAMIDVNGMIVDGPTGLLGGGENPVARLADGLERAAEDDEVRAVIVRVNSRGGTVTASDMVHAEVLRFREMSGKPVVMLLGEIAASGGYYLACAGDRIVAHPTTVTGSIGVITQTVYVADALERWGVELEALTSGPNKAMGSPLGRPNDQHLALLQGLVDEFYGRFRGIVRDRRPDISAADFDRLTDGRVVTGVEAHATGLVDAVGDATVAYAMARELAGAPGARLVRYVRPGQRTGGVYAGGRATAGSAGGGGSGAAGDSSAASAAAGSIELNLFKLDAADGVLLPRTRFMYVWAGG